MTDASEAPSKSLVAKHAASIQGMDWRQLLEHSKLASTHEDLHERAAIATAHNQRLVSLGLPHGADRAPAPATKSPELDKVPPDSANALQRIIERHNTLMVAAVNDTVSYVETIPGLRGDVKALMEDRRRKHKAAQDAITDETFDSGEAEVASNPPEAQMAAANVFLAAMRVELDAYAQISRAMDKAFKTVVDGINVAVRAVQDAGRKAGDIANTAIGTISGIF